MARIDFTIDVERPVEEVFAYLTDLAEPLVVKAVERQTENDFETLKDLLESRS